MSYWLKRLRCKLGFHLWSYGGYKVDCSDGSYCINGYRVCILCTPYVRQRWRSGWEGKGKSKWVIMSGEQFRDKECPYSPKPQEPK